MLALASHKQLHIYGFSIIVNLLVSAPGTALLWWCVVLDMSPVKLQSQYKNIRFLMFAFLNTTEQV